MLSFRIMDKKELKGIIQHYKLLVWAFSFGLLFQAWWMRDYSVAQYVALPLFYTSGHILGTKWFELSVILEGIALVMMFISIHKIIKLKALFPLLFYIAGDFVAIVSFFLYKKSQMTITTYGIIWNDMLYLIMIPAIIITNFLILKNSKLKN